MTAPAIILVRPQLGENIGAAARAMANFGLADLRVVAPRDGWPNPAAEAMAAGGLAILQGARLCDSVEEAVRDLHRVWAASARSRDMLKPDATPEQAVTAIGTGGGDEACGILFGPERSGLDNDEVALAHALLRIPTAPDVPSINLGQAVVVVGYEWFRSRAADPAAAAPGNGAQPATMGEMEMFFDHLIGELDGCGFLRNREHRPVMVRNIRNMFLRAGLHDQEVRTLRGIVSCLVSARRPLPPGEGT